MTDTAATLASPPAALQDQYDIVIVGSGYGGGIMAARLAVANAGGGHRLRIALLERGEEHPTGTFRESATDAASIVRSPVNALGLVEIERNPTVDVIHANGLGGTSLVNFNVAIEPDREVFLQSWPRAFRELVDRDPSGVGALATYFERARKMLGANRFAEGESLRRVEVFRRIAKNAGAEVVPLDITVNKQDRLTRYGVQRRACPMHGGDGSGDNSGSKNSLMTNYLPMASHFGVEMFTRVEVDHLERNADGTWRIVCLRRGGSKGVTTTDVVVTASRVILSAGTMGTNAILLKSKEAGLGLSPRVGKNFSGNGDSFGIAYNTDLRTDTQAWAMNDGPPRSGLACGPSITVMMKFGADQADLRKRFTVQDLSVPRALQDTFRLGLLALAAARYPHIDWKKVNRWRRDATGFNVEGAMNHSLGFLIMVHDNSDGRVLLQRDGSVKVDWLGAPTERMYKDVDDILRPAVEAIGGTYMKNPWWTNSFFGNHLITAHPMGGASTADNVDGGVVDHAGRLFRPDGGVYDNLHVVDGSVIPRALGVNPFLTISMFAERAAEQLRTELGLPGYDPAAEADDY